MNLNEWQHKIGVLMWHKGHHDDFKSPATPLQMRVEKRLNRLHGEVAEVGEVVKKKFDTAAVEVKAAAGEAVYDEMAEELADVIYRTLDLAYLLDLNVEAALTVKHAKNALRPDKYGTSDEGKA